MSIPWSPCCDWEKHVVHKAPICESNNLANTPLPALNYKIRRPDRHCESKCSTFQIETCAYACQSLLMNKCFLLADSTGIGKSRTIASIMDELHEGNTRFLWVSVNSRLMKDAQYELDVIESPLQLVQVHDTNPNSIAKFTSYSALLNNDTLKVVETWLRGAHRTLVILDEAHSCRNDSATFKCVSRLMTMSNSMLLYSTATVASSLRHLRYLERMGIWGPKTGFESHDNFCEKMRSHGTAVMELLIMQLKLQGKLVSRQLSFHGVNVDFDVVDLTSAQRELYDDCCNVFKFYYNAGMERQSFFQKLITRFKIDRVLHLVHDALSKNMSVVVSLQATGEAALYRGVDACAEILEHLTMEDHTNSELLSSISQSFFIRDHRRRLIHFAPCIFRWCIMPLNTLTL